jgi:uncharacterized membrane protein
MDQLRTISLYVMAALYFAGGVNHFRNPVFYLRMMPPYLPAHAMLNAVAGIAELILAVGLVIPVTRPWAAWGVIALLVAVFPAHVYMFQRGGAAYGTSDWVLAARMPLQAVLIAWAWWYT